MNNFKRKGKLNRERGSMPIALFITIMFLALSVALVGVVASQIAQNRSEDSARQAHIGLGSAIAIAAEQIGPSARALVNLPTIEPSAWTALGNDTNNSFYHWWVSSSSNSVLVPSNIPVGNWASVTYGNNIWVAVNTAGTAFTSPDGLTWTQRNALPNVGTLNYTNLTYGLGSFIATPSTAATNIATSPDGIVWTSVTIASGTYIPSCSTTTCVFLSTTSAAGYYTTNLTSFNAMASVPFIAKAVTFAISNFVMSGNNAIATSLDASTWTSRTVSAHNWGLVGSVNGVYVAAETLTAGSKAIVTSTDGITWTDRVLPQSGNWVAIATAGPQIGLFSGPIASINQSSYLGSSNTTSWVSNPLPAGAPWTAAFGNYKSFFVMQSTNPSYLIPVSGSVSSSQTLTVTTRLQQGRLTNANNGQYYASIVYTWNVAGRKWLASKYVGPSTPGLSLVPNAPTGVVGNRTAPGVINVSWIPPSNSGSSAVTSYLATASPGGYYCASGAQLSGTTCTITSTSVASHTAITYQCTSGDSPSGTQSSAFTCTHTTTYAANYTASTYQCTTGDSPAGVQSSALTCSHTYGANYTATTYQCSSGDSPSGVQATAVTCSHSTTYGANYTPTTYRCNSGDTPSGVQSTAVTCTHTTTYAANYQPPVYQCTSGDTPSGTQSSSFTCTHTVAANYSGPTYQCTSGDSPGGIQGSPFTCTHSSSSTYTSSGTAAYYSCSSGTLSGSSCIITVAQTTGCPSGYTYDNPSASCLKYIGAGGHNNWSCATGYTFIYGDWWTGAPDYWTNAPATSDAAAQGACVTSGTSMPGITSYTPPGTCPANSTPIQFNSGTNYTAGNYYRHSSKGSGYEEFSSCLPLSYTAQDNQNCPSGGTPATGINLYWCTTSSGSSYAATGTTTTTYSCSSGTLSGSNCITSSASYTATYTAAHCSYAGYTQAQCGGPSTAPYGTWYVAGYSCPSGGTLSGTTCTIAGTSTPATASSTTTYSCPSGGTLSGSTCTTSGTGYWSSHYNYTCPSGGTLSGTTCTGGSVINATGNDNSCGWPAIFGSPYYDASPNIVYINGACYSQQSLQNTCPSGYTGPSGGNCTLTVPATSNPGVYQCTSGDTPSGTQSSAFTCTHITLTTYSSPGAAGYYYCSTGTLSGTNCLITYASPLTAAAYYYCTSGDTPASTSPTTFTCTNTTTYSAPVLVAAYYSCTAGDTPVTTSPTTFTCTHTTTYSAPVLVAAYYSCTSGDTPATTSPSTFTCTHTYSAPVLVAAYYSCTAGDTPVTTSPTTFTCTHTTTYLSSGTAAFYSCSSGILSGNLCLTTVTSTATYNSGGYTCSSGTQTNCTISGMTNGVYTFTVTAANNVGTSVASIASALTAPQLLTLSYPSTVFSIGQTSQVLTPLVTGSSGASLTYSESGVLPSGVTFNSSTGALTGPSSWGSPTGYPFTITVTATDSLTGYTISTPVTFTLITP